MESHIIKVCGVTTREDAEAAIEAGANAIGFNFYPKSPRFVEWQPWMANVPALKVGVFVGAVTHTEGLDIVQVYGEGTAIGLRVWRAVKPNAELRDAEAFVMDVSEGTGQTFDWSLVANRPARIVLAGGLGGDNVADAIRVARPWGVDACSRLESSPGRKDRAKVREFVAAAREGFSQA